MNIGKRFEGDENMALQQVQSYCYSGYYNHVGRLFGICSDRFLTSAKLVEATSELIEGVMESSTFDHRTLQEAHDFIAAYYRHAVDKGQPELNFEQRDYGKVLLENWVAWYRAELEKLVQFDSFTRSVCIAAVFPNADERGKAAKEALVRFLEDHYRRDDDSPFAISGLTPQ